MPKLLNSCRYLLVLLFLLTGCHSGQEAPAGPKVVTDVARMDEIVDKTSYSATIQAQSTVNLLPRIEGYLQVRYFKEGQIVEAGEPLYKIEPYQYETIVAQKEADLAGAEATLQERTLNVERFRTLLDKRVVAQSAADQAESDFSNATANVKAAQAALRDAKLNLSYTDIIAPMKGRIGATTVFVGDYIAPGMPALASIVQLDPIRAVFSLSEQQWSLIAEHHHETSDINKYLTPYIQLSNGQLYEKPGKIDFIDNHINTNTGSIALYALFDNPDYLLLPGQFVTLVLQEGAPRNAITVPEAAVAFDKNGYYVLRVNADNIVERCAVTTGSKQNTRIEIVQGLNVGDKVITEGLQKVTPGMSVT